MLWDLQYWWSNGYKELLPDNLGGFGDILPILDTGEALVVGDASLLPSRIRIDKPLKTPDSGTVDFLGWMAEKMLNLIELVMPLIIGENKILIRINYVNEIILWKYK